jgi:hypothetical protein
MQEPDHQLGGGGDKRCEAEVVDAHEIVGEQVLDAPAGRGFFDLPEYQAGSLFDASDRLGRARTINVRFASRQLDTGRIPDI